MKIELPLLEQKIKDGSLISEETSAMFDLDTSVYSEERWEKHFPELASREGLFQYIDRIHSAKASGRVKVACMLKAVFCFIESESISTYKQFAQMFNLATPEYTNRLIHTLYDAFKIILESSTVKN